MIDLLLFSLPTWAVVVCVVLYVPGSIGLGLLIGRAFAWNDRRVAERDEDRLLDLAEESRRDTEQRRLRAWDGIGDEMDNVIWLPEREPAEVIAIPTDLMEHDGLGAA